MFRWADVDDLGSVTDEQVIDLFDNVRQAVPGLVHKKQMISAMLSVPRDRDKRIGAPSFHSLCNSWPYLYFPLVRLQVHMYTVVATARCSCPHHYHWVALYSSGALATAGDGHQVLAQEEASAGQGSQEGKRRQAATGPYQPGTAWASVAQQTNGMCQVTPRLL